MERITIYNYKKIGEVQGDTYPHSEVLTQEVTNGLYWVKTDQQTIVKTEDEGATVSTVSARSNFVISMYYDRSNELIYWTELSGTSISTVYYIDLSDDSITQVGGAFPLDDAGDYCIIADVFLYSGDVYAMGIYIDNINGKYKSRIYKYVDPNWTQQATVDLYSWTVYANSAYYSDYAGVAVGTKYYFNNGYYESGGVQVHETVLIEYDFSTPALTIKKTTSNYRISGSNGIASDGSNILTMTYQSQADSVTYLYQYLISTDTLTEIAKRQITFMPDRCTNSSAEIPYNLEKGYNTLDLGVYQIRSNLLDVVKIAEMDGRNDYSGINKGISDTYLWEYVSGTGKVYLWKFQSMNSYVVYEWITHPEKGCPSAIIQYDSAILYLAEGMFVQIIYTFKGVANQVVFEGYVQFPEDEDIENPRLKICNLISSLDDDFCNNYYKGTQSAGRTDEHFQAIVTDTCNYGSNGSVDSGSSLPETTYKGSIELEILSNQLAILDGFTWYASPTGVLDFDDGTTDSTVDYADNSAPYIFNVEISKRDKIYNKIHVEGAYVDGTLIESDTDGEDEDSQIALGIQELTFSIPWVNTVALANSYAQAICDMLSSSITIVEFTVLDTTNGMLQPGEEITLTLANNPYRTITAAQYKINEVRFNARTGIAEYTVSSSVYYKPSELEGGASTVSENLDQIATYVNSEGGDNDKTGWNLDAVLALSFTDGTRTFTITPTGTATYYINNVKYSISAADTVVITDTEGEWYIYYSGSTLTASQTPWEFSDNDKAFVAIIYWDATNNEHIWLAYECHKWVMDNATHERFHDVDGAQVSSGGTLSDFSVDGNGTLDAHCQFQNDVTVIHDEDIEITHTARTKTSNLSKYYLDGAGVWRVDEDDSFPVVHTGVGGEVRAAWNEFSGGTWSLTEVGNNKYLLAHVFASTDKTRKYGVIIGQAEYNNKSAAHAGANTELGTIYTTGLPAEEYRFLGTIILYTSDSYSNTPYSIIVSTDEGDNYVEWLTKLSGRAGIDIIHFDAYAFHNNIDGEFNLLTEKTSIVENDILVIEDSDASNAKKQVLFSTTGIGNTGGTGYYKDSAGFNLETVGDQNTDIAWIASVGGTDSSILAEIIASEDGHNNVMKVSSDGDNGTVALFYHTLGSATSDTLNLWAKYIDNGVGYLIFYFEDGSGNLMYFYFNSSDNKFYYNYGNGAGGTTSGNVDATADTWYPIKIIYSTDTDTFDIYFNNVLLASGLPFVNDRTSTGITSFSIRLQFGAGANALEGYIDAWGEASDANYEDGDYFVNGKWLKTDFIKLEDNWLYQYFHIGSRNPGWKSCGWLDANDDNFSIVTATQEFVNDDDTDTAINWLVDVPKTLGSLSCYIDAIKFTLTDADAGDYVDSTQISEDGSATTVDTGNQTSIGTTDPITFTARDISSKNSVWVVLNLVLTNAGDFGISDVSIRYYYA